MIHKLSKGIDKMNEFGKQRIPFFFLIKYDLSQIWLCPTAKLDSRAIQIQFPDYNFGISESKPEKMLQFRKFPLSLTSFQQKFEFVMEQIQYGNSFLTNLTVKTPIECNYSLKEIFLASRAKYKVWLADQFVFFSPETFLKIINGKIYTYPMKGTIDGGLPHAETIILEDKKETAEHITIVDLLRNDLSQVATHVEVSRFRYIDILKTHEKSLLQVSSEIKGDLQDDWNESLGDLMLSVLPAGSISGAPKIKTIKIIERAERYDRGFYTGIAGYFDGMNLDSTVMIRFIEQEKGKLYFKSGVGLTAFSDLQSEYQELIDKIYVPVY